MLVTRYEDLVTNPRHNMTQICEFLDIQFMPEKMVVSNTLKSNIVKDFEVWKGSITSEILNKNVSCDKLFGKMDVLRIQQKISPYNKLFGYQEHLPYLQKTHDFFCSLMRDLNFLIRKPK